MTLEWCNSFLWDIDNAIYKLKEQCRKSTGLQVHIGF